MSLLAALAALIFLGATPQTFQGDPSSFLESQARGGDDSGVRNILLIHSYHQGYPWTDELVRGIQATFEDAPFRSELWFEYLDSRRFQSAGKAVLESLLESKYSNRRFDLILLSDDDALLFVKQIHDRVFPGVPVVFCGVNDTKAVEDLPRSIYTGVLEYFESESILELALRFHPKSRRVVVVSDNTIPGRMQRRSLEAAADEHPSLAFDFLDATSLGLDEILEALRQTPVDSVVITTGFTQDAAGAHYPADEAARKIAEASPVPVYSPSISRLGQGIVGGTENGGFRHGTLAAGLGVRILEGENPSEIPLVEDRENTYVFDYNRLKELGISESELPLHSRVINHAPTFYEQYRGVFWGGVLFLSAQTTIIALLIVNITRRRKAERESLARAEELSLNNEVLASLNRSLGEEVEERRRVEAALRVSEASLGRAQRVASLGSWDYQPGASAMVWSEELFRIFGLDPMTSSPTLAQFFDFVNPSDQEDFKRSFDAAMKGKRALAIECSLMRPDGTERYVRHQADLMEGPSGVRLVGTVQDITDLHRIEEQFQQSQKLEAVGRLAGGVAHDFNNLLTIINCYAEMLLAGVEQDSLLKPQLEEILKAGQKAADLTAQLLAFSRKHVVQRKRVNLNQIVTESEKMLRRLIGEDVTLECRLDDQLDRTFADPGQLHQVILNLAVNARDAMPGGGRLTISTSNVKVESDAGPGKGGLQPGSYVELAVIDTGCGMDEETRRRAFEPFFTTKPIGQGSGLGLSTVYGIVSQNGGGVELQSASGSGTAVRIYLPASEEEESGVNRIPGEVLHGTEKILLVEDQDEVREVVARTLRGYGYSVLTANGGQEAIEISLSSADPLDLLITDIVMPGMRGPELADRLRQDRPGMAVLYISGYTDASMMDLGTADSGMAFLQKPFRPEDLAAKVREVLAHPNAA